MAVALVGVFGEIILVIVFGDVKFLGRRNLGHDRVGKNVFPVKDGLVVLGFLFLIVIVIENDRAILSSDIRTLTIQRRRVVGRPKDF